VIERFRLPTADCLLSPWGPNVETVKTVAWYVILVYVLMLAALFGVMRQPILFGRVMSKVPGPMLKIIPLKPLWFLARAGHLQVGDQAPEFSLPTVDRKARVRLSSFRGHKPVVLIFGSYT
jgi:hypothetical protein